jgi:hypothetical protein
MAVQQLIPVTDPIAPTLIEHRVDAAKYPDTGEMAHYYNYIHYEFAAPAGKVEALTYLHDPELVIVTVPDGTGIDCTDAKNVLAYLQLRFERVEVRDESGNELLSWALSGEAGPQ